MRTSLNALLRSLPLSLAMTLGYAGCTGNLNRSDGLVDSNLPDLEGRMPGEPPASEAPSLSNGADRQHWDKTTIVIARRQVEVQPWGVSDVQYDKSTARERGDFPTSATVLEGPGDAGMAAWEATAAPFWAATDLLMSPIRVFIAPPWATVRVPQHPPSLLPEIRNSEPIPMPTPTPASTPAAASGSVAPASGATGS